MRLRLRTLTASVEGYGVSESFSFIAVFATSINDQVEQAGTKLPTVLIIDHDSREGYIR